MNTRLVLCTLARSFARLPTCLPAHSIAHSLLSPCIPHAFTLRESRVRLGSDSDSIIKRARLSNEMLVSKEEAASTQPPYVALKICVRLCVGCVSGCA